MLPQPHQHAAGEPIVGSKEWTSQPASRIATSNVQSSLAAGPRREFPVGLPAFCRESLVKESGLQEDDFAARGSLNLMPKL